MDISGCDCMKVCEGVSVMCEGVICEGVMCDEEGCVRM